MGAGWIVRTVKETIKRHGKPEIIISDQGSQFTSEEYVSFVKKLENVKISMGGKGRAIDTVYIERFFRTEAGFSGGSNILIISWISRIS